MERRYFTPQTIDLDEAFHDVAGNSSFANHRDLLEQFWATLRNHIEWLEIEAWELGSNHEPEHLS